MIRCADLHEFGFANLGLCLIWGASVVSGTLVMLNYDSRPCDNPDQLAVWPAQSHLNRPQNRPQVIMFVHPHCPCTRASVAELARIHAVCHRDADFQVVALEPVNAGRQWRSSRIVEMAANIPSTSVFWDLAGREANRFHVTTSGHVVLYDCRGRLRFSGGITSARGHEGSSLGRDRLMAWLRTGDNGSELNLDLFEAPVFGCSLVDRTETTRHE